MFSWDVQYVEADTWFYRIYIAMNSEFCALHGIHLLLKTGNQLRPHMESRQYEKFQRLNFLTQLNKCLSQMKILKTMIGGADEVGVLS